MKVLMPFPYLQIFDRYSAQMGAIATKIDEFHVAYVSGEPTQEWKRTFVFHQFMNYPYDPKRSGWTKKILQAPHLVTRTLMSNVKMQRLLQNRDIDLAYALASFWPVELARYFAVKAKKPYVLRLRGNLLTELKIKETYPIRAFYLASLLHNMKEANLVIPITERIKAEAIYCGIDAHKVSEPIGLGVDPNLFHPYTTVKSRCLTLIYVGRLSEEKGIYRLIELAKDLPNVLFYLAGTKQTSLALPSNVLHVGRVPHHLMPDFYNIADCVVLPSFTEGLPNVLLEAYACGKPILATPEAFPREMRLFGLVKQFSEWKKTIKDYANGFQELAKGAREHVQKHYTWDRFGERMVAELEKVCWK